MQNFIVSCCSYCFEDVLPIFSDTMGVKLSSVSCLSCLLRLLCLSPISLDLSTLCLIFFLSWLFSSSVMIDLSFSISLAFPIQLLVDVIGFDNSFFLRWLICYEWSVFFQSVWLFQWWLTFFFPSYWLLQLQLIFLLSFILASSASVDIVIIDLSLFLWHFSSICLLWLVFFFPSYWLLQLQLILLWLIYLCSLFKVRSWCTLVQLGICTIIWLFKWHKHCGFRWCNFILMFDVA